MQDVRLYQAKVLIGASGFVGSAILKEVLARGHKIKAVVRNPEKITFKDPDLTVEAGMRSASARSILISGGFTQVYNGGSWTRLRKYKTS